MPKAAANGVHSDAPAAALLPSKSRPFTAKLVAKEGLCTLSGAPAAPLLAPPGSSLAAGSTFYASVVVVQSFRTLLCTLPAAICEPTQRVC